jgi:hypothetical protein
MKLFEILSDKEKVAAKAALVRNVYVKDLTIEELSNLNDLLEYKFSDHVAGSVKAHEEVLLRKNHKEVTS